VLVFIATWWFWIAVVELIFLFAVLAYDKGWAAGVSLPIFGVLLYWLGDVDFITFFKENPSYLVYGALIYFPVGAAWATFKWFMLVSDKKTKYKESKADFLRRYNITDFNISMSEKSVNDGILDQKVLDAWKVTCRSYPYDLQIPQAREYKYHIMRWLGYWPFSVVWTVISDFVRRISKAIYNAIHGALQAISNKIFADVKGDF
jgi:hypothetical protein